MKIRKALLCAITFMVMVSLMLPLGCTKETMLDTYKIIETTEERFTEVASYHSELSVTLELSAYPILTSDTAVSFNRE